MYVARLDSKKEFESKYEPIAYCCAIGKYMIILSILLKNDVPESDMRMEKMRFRE